MSELAKAAAKVLAERSVTAPAVGADERARSIAAIQRAMAARAAMARRRRIGGVVAAVAVAAAVALGIGLGHGSAKSLHGTSVRLAPGEVTMTATRVDDGVQVERSGDATGRHALAPQAALGAGDRVVAPSGAHVLLAFSTGAGVTLEGADVTVLGVEAMEQLDLRGGAVVANVAALAPGRRFVVDAPDAAIEADARGASFRIDVAPTAACGGRTRLVVTQGSVTVRSATGVERVAGGAAWPAPCTAELGAPTAAKDAGAASAAAPTVRATNGASAVSTPDALTAQNDLFADAMTAKRRGDSAGAIAALDTLLARYPGGPLSESAEVERFRLVRDVDAGRAAELARSYLRRYPKGFARDEARTIAGP